MIVLALINWFTIARIFGPGPSQALGFTTIALSLLCIPLGVKYFRDKLNNGQVSFAEAFKIGTGITLVTSLVMFFYGLLFWTLQGEEMRQWQFANMSEAELQQAQAQLAEMPEYMSAVWFQGVIMFMMVFLIGLIINTTSALVLKR